MKFSVSVLALASLLSACMVPVVPREARPARNLGPFDLARSTAAADPNAQIRRRLINELEAQSKHLDRMGAGSLNAFVQTNVVLFTDAQMLVVLSALTTFEKNSDPKETLGAFYARQGETIKMVQEEFNVLASRGQ